MFHNESAFSFKSSAAHCIHWDIKAGFIFQISDCMLSPPKTYTDQESKYAAFEAQGFILGKKDREVLLGEVIL